MCEYCNFIGCHCECGVLELKEIVSFMGETLKTICICRKCGHDVEIRHV